MYHLDEKDLQSKLSLLFKKNLYDIAVRIAKSSQHDPEGLADIFKQYGDHLYGKGDFAGAVDQYIKTIGYLEPSYIIRRFLDSRHINYLTDYLQVGVNTLSIHVEKVDSLAIFQFPVSNLGDAQARQSNGRSYNAFTQLFHSTG